MLGAGGILFLGPLVFNRLGLASTTIGLGLALASGVGLIARFLSGYILDRGAALAIPLRIGAVLCITADLVLLQASNSSGFLIGQLLLGLGMGFYWPAAEFASASLSAPLPSSQGFALARTADALGIAAGTALGTLLAALFGADQLRWVYGVDISCMVLLLVLVGWLPRHSAMPNASETPSTGPEPPRSWLRPLLPLLVLSLLGTGLINLQQSALPLDLANGGLARAGLPEVGGGLLMGVQLVLILLLQWPVGHRLGQQPVGVGLRLSLRSFAAGLRLDGAVGAASPRRCAAARRSTLAGLSHHSVLAHHHRSGDRSGGARPPRPGPRPVFASVGHQRHQPAAAGRLDAAERTARLGAVAADGWLQSVGVAADAASSEPVDRFQFSWGSGSVPYSQSS